MTMFVDTHAHLTDDRFHDDLPAEIERASAAGVEHTICVATTATDSAACIQVAAKYASIWASVGIQPNNVAGAMSGDWDTVVQLVESSRVVAVGETGLDRHWDLTPFSMQEDYFVRHLDLARRFDLPVIIHCREAEADLVRVLSDRFDRYGIIRGVMHSFTGDSATAEACWAMGLHISFAGMVTYKNSASLREVAQSIPADRIVIETDAPYLAPVPMRGKRNEPAYVVHTASVVAAERSISLDEFSAQATSNSLELFRLAAQSK
jgi:TatD DNase family protein